MTSRRAHSRLEATRAVMTAVAVLALVLDRVTKLWALHALSAHDRQIIQGWLSLHLVYNSGAAFSMGTSFTALLSCISAAALVFVLVWVFPRARGWLASWASGLIAAGIAGNLLDRFLREPGPMRGTVVDFIAVRYFAVFNVADMCITCAAILFVWWAVRSDRTVGRSGRPADAAAGRVRGAGGGA
ncbi:signal peptidase II [uncultured Propionibacterium sp.]|uniref:signal peptidase II n=1 Tax=uncultured Propionibacterium sp. TaxID=218066 RepID=UPI00292D947B|nr:signal peptidase II [uncultured Propionibacterium sp.]